MKRNKGGSSAARVLKKCTSIGSKQSGDSFTSSSSIKESVDASEAAASEGTEAQRALRKVASRGDSESGTSGTAVNPKGSPGGKKGLLGLETRYSQKAVSARC